LDANCRPLKQAEQMRNFLSWGKLWVGFSFSVLQADRISHVSMPFRSVPSWIQVSIYHDLSSWSSIIDCIPDRAPSLPLLCLPPFF
jgi:hypothetical protein